MKVIFLETDGVLQTHRTQYLQRAGAVVFDSVAVSLINEIIRETDAKIVFTTKLQEVGESAFQTIVEGNGFNWSNVHHDAFVCRHTIASREQEIARWMSQHPEVTHAVVVSDVHPDIDCNMNFVVTSTFNGLTYGNFIDILKVFNDDHTKSPWYYNS